MVNDFFTILAGKAWRSATEMVAQPDLLSAAQSYVKGQGAEQQMSKEFPPVLPPRGFSR